MLKQTIQKDLTEFQKERNALAVSVLRMALSEIKNKEIEKKTEELPEEEVLAVLLNQVKRRQESAEQFATGGRQDLADKEKAELEVLQVYLPEQMSDEDLQNEVQAAVKETGASAPADMGKVMGVLSPKLKGRVDGRKLSEAVRAALGGTA